jgi:hypothetical protein
VGVAAGASGVGAGAEGVAGGGLAQPATLSMITLQITGINCKRMQNLPYIKLRICAESCHKRAAATTATLV